jgi:hypothetical protein
MRTHGNLTAKLLTIRGPMLGNGSAASRAHYGDANYSVYQEGLSRWPWAHSNTNTAWTRPHVEFAHHPDVPRRGRFPEDGFGLLEVALGLCWLPALLG